MMPGERWRWRITRRCIGRARQRAIYTSCVQLNVSGVPLPARITSKRRLLFGGRINPEEPYAKR